MSAAGNFNVFISSSDEVRLSFELNNPKGDEVLMKRFKSYFECGICYTNQGQSEEFSVVKLSDILEKIIPLFTPLNIRLGDRKYQDFLD